MGVATGQLSSQDIGQLVKFIEDDYSVTDLDWIIACRSSLKNLSIIIPADLKFPAELTICDADGNASENSISVTSPERLMNGETILTISVDWGSVRLLILDASTIIVMNTSVNLGSFSIGTILMANMPKEASVFIDGDGSTIGNGATLSFVEDVVPEDYLYKSIPTTEIKGKNGESIVTLILNQDGPEANFHIKRIDRTTVPVNCVLRFKMNTSNGGSFIFHDVVEYEEGGNILLPASDPFTLSGSKGDHADFEFDEDASLWRFIAGSNY